MEYPPDLSPYVTSRASRAFDKRVREGKLPKTPPAVVGSHYPVQWFRMAYRWQGRSFRCDVAFIATNLITKRWQWFILGHTFCVQRGVYRSRVSLRNLFPQEIPMEVVFTASEAKRYIVDTYENYLTSRVEGALQLRQVNIDEDVDR